MDPTVAVNESYKYLFTQGVLGFFLFIAGVILYYAWKEIKSERSRCNEQHADMMKLGAEIVRTNIDVARTQEERNRQIGELTQAQTRLSTAIEHLGDIIELNQKSISDRQVEGIQILRTLAERVKQ